MVFVDIFRSYDDMGGLAKALWVIFVIILPFLGVFVYLIARGGRDAPAGGRNAAAQQQQRPSTSTSARWRGADGGLADQLSTLVDLKEQGGHHRRRVRSAEVEDSGQLTCVPPSGSAQ